MFKLSQSSTQKLVKVHPALVRVVNKALSYGVIDFSVNEGLRTRERQTQLVAAGLSKTMDSKHLIQASGYGHAVDLYPVSPGMKAINRGSAVEIIRFGVIAGVMFCAAKELGVKIRWGADWDSDGLTLDHSFFDAPHYELVLD